MSENRSVSQNGCEQTVSEIMAEKDRQLAESRALLEHFLKAYSSAYTVDLKADTFEILHMDHAFQQVFTMNGTRRDMERFIEEYVHPDDKEKLRLLTDNNYIRQRLQTESEIRFAIRELYNGVERTMHAVILRGADADHAAIGFIDVTNELREQREANRRLEAINKTMEDYRHAVLSQALIAFTANLTQNMLVSGFWVDDNGREITLRDILGIDPPCSYDQYIYLWRRKFVFSGSQDEFKDYTDRKSLLDAYESGRREITFDYPAKTISNNKKYLRRVINLTQDTASGDIIAYTSVKDVTREVQTENENRMQMRVISRLADRYSDVYLLDVKTREVKPLRMSGNASCVDTDLKRGAPYETMMATYIENNVCPQDRLSMYAAADLHFLLEKLSKNVDFLHHYRAHVVGNVAHYYYMQASRLGEADSFSHIVLGFACEDEEKQREKALEDAMIAAQSANQAKSAFLFNMSHDIRTPMNAIIGFTEMAQKYIYDPKRVLDYLDKVRSSSEHLLSLINDVLDMSRVESGKVSVSEAPENLDIEMDRLYSMFNSHAQENRITLRMTIDGSVRHRNIYMDRLIMTRVMTNVISNSIKYTKAGGSIDVTVSEQPASKAGCAHFRYEVADTGVGMSEAFLAELFVPFARAENSTKSGIIGTGLGMTITRSLVEIMGGTIAVESEEGKGTKVTIDIEHRIADAPVKKQHIDVIENMDLLEGKKVLLAEDNDLNREIAIDMLEEVGMEVDSAEDGDIAVEKVKQAAPGRYDLILMDIQMPTMNGYDATRAIRALPDKEKAGIPIIAMTANAFEEDKRNAMEAGMNAHIAKPVSIPVLIRAMMEVFK